MDSIIENKIHTVIFDLDGTLSDSAILTMAAFERVAPKANLPVPGIEAVRSATGNPNPQFYYILFPELDREMVFNMGQMVEAVELDVLPSVKDRLLFPGCRELLIQLKKKGISLCIASTGDREHVYSILRETGIQELFDVVSCGQPDKIEMLRTLTAKGDKRGYLMVGDMKKDSEGARANGILSVGVCYGYCRRELAEFDMYIDAPFDLLGLL